MWKHEESDAKTEQSVDEFAAEQLALRACL